MMAKSFKKLMLRRETVRRLRRSELDRAGGGYGYTDPPTFTCKPTCDQHTCADTCVYPCEIPPETLALTCV